MQHETVDVVCAEMLQRTGERLSHLNLQRRGRIVRQAMILATLVGVLGLEKQIGARDYSCAIGCG